MINVFFNHYTSGVLSISKSGPLIPLTVWPLTLDICTKALNIPKMTISLYYIRS